MPFKKRFHDDQTDPVNEDLTLDTVQYSVEKAAKIVKEAFNTGSFAAGESVSTIVPTLQAGAGVTLTRGDVHYVVSELLSYLTYLAKRQGLPGFNAEVLSDSVHDACLRKGRLRSDKE